MSDTGSFKGTFRRAVNEVESKQNQRIKADPSI